MQAVIEPGDVKEPLNLKELYWLAGFLEGEGTFYWVKRGQRPLITAVQVQKQPLERIKATFGGAIRLRKRPSNSRNNQDCYTWTLYNKNAVSLMMTLYCLMSHKRQGQIKKVLDNWRARWNQWDSRGCRNGHPWTVENTYIWNGTKSCRICKAAYGKTKLKTKVATVTA